LKKIFTVVLSVVLLALIGAGIVGIYAYSTLFRAVETAADRDFTVNAGESYISVVMRLENRGLVPSALALQLYGRVTGSDTAVQKGSYIIPENLSPVEVMEYLSSGHQSLIRVTIPEGRTLGQVARILDGSGIVGEEDFLRVSRDTEFVRSLGIAGDTAEGYIYPETYYFAEDFPAEKVVAHMVNTFFAALGDIFPDYASLSARELHETVILASIVEREYMADHEAPLIASVFNNRLERGMRLESCATVVYVMTEIEGLDHPTRLFFSDLNRPSEFNTYVNRGLPPAPISGVGAIALNAAFYPADSDYLFFVLQSPQASEHVFSESYEDHLSASEVYYFKLN
jgi:UPF0755 protein